MLIDFTVANFRSIREAQTLSLKRNTSYKELREHCFDPQAPNAPQLLKVAVIYGPNTSGKTNLLKALDYMLQRMQNHSVAYDTEPFMFDSECAEQPSRFVLHGIVELQDAEGNTSPVKAEYGFELLNDVVVSEWLDVYPQGRKQIWFSRSFDREADKYDWNFSIFLKGEKLSLAYKTDSHTLFLFIAATFKNEQLLQVYQGLIKQRVVLSHDLSDSHTIKLLQQYPLFKDMVVMVYNAVDIPIVDLELRPQEIDEQLHPSSVDATVETSTAQEVLPYLVYDYNGLVVKRALVDEASGIKQLFKLIGVMFEVFLQGKVTLLLDEIQDLHPLLLSFIVEMFNSEVNTRNSQLILTTHTTYLLRRKELRRDQIWFCDREHDFTTHLFPLVDFSPLRDREDFEEMYLNGSYRAIPLLRKFFAEHFDLENNFKIK